MTASASNDRQPERYGSAARLHFVEAIGKIASEETQRHRVRNAQHALRYRAELARALAVPSVDATADLSIDADDNPAPWAHASGQTEEKETT